MCKCSWKQGPSLRSRAFKPCKISRRLSRWAEGNQSNQLRCSPLTPDSFVFSLTTLLGEEGQTREMIDDRPHHFLCQQRVHSLLFFACFLPLAARKENRAATVMVGCFRLRQTWPVLVSQRRKRHLVFRLDRTSEPSDKLRWPICKDESRFFPQTVLDEWF